MIRLPALTLAFALLVSAALPAQTPELSLSHEAWDFGTRIQGDRDVEKVTLRNGGKGRLIIGRVEVTCGCVTARLARREIEPGGEAEIVLTLDTSRTFGKIAKHLRITSNDPESPRREIPVTGEIIPIWRLSTKNLNFGEVEEGATPTARFRIHVAPGRDHAIVRVHEAGRGVDLAVTPFGETAGDHGWEVAVTLRGDLRIGRFGALVTVEMDCPVKPREALVANAEILGPVVVKPRRLAFGALRVDESKTLVVVVERRRGEGLVIEKVSCSDPQISVETVEKAAGRVFEIRVTCRPRAGSARVAGRLHVVTNEPRQKVFPIYYRAGVVPG